MNGKLEILSTVKRGYKPSGSKSSRTEAKGHREAIEKDCCMTVMIKPPTQPCRNFQKKIMFKEC